MLTDLALGLERWYLGISFLGFMIPIGPAIVGWFGKDQQLQIWSVFFSHYHFALIPVLRVVVG
jgi:hypothetical protein